MGPANSHERPSRCGTRYLATILPNESEDLHPRAQKRYIRENRSQKTIKNPSTNVEDSMAYTQMDMVRELERMPITDEHVDFHLDLEDLTYTCTLIGWLGNELAELPTQTYLELRRLTRDQELLNFVDNQINILQMLQGRLEYLIDQIKEWRVHPLLNQIVALLHDSGITAESRHPWRRHISSIRSLAVVVQIQRATAMASVDFVRKETPVCPWWNHAVSQLMEDMNRVVTGWDRIVLLPHDPIPLTPASHAHVLLDAVSQLRFRQELKYPKAEEEEEEEEEVDMLRPKENLTQTRKIKARSSRKQRAKEAKAEKYRLKTARLAQRMALV